MTDAAGGDDPDGIWQKRKENRMDKNLTRQDRISGGLYGLLIGDALGVPYEFYEPENLPPYEEIEMIPPAGFRKTYEKVEAGTWSDDGAQALCLLQSLLDQNGFSLEDFSDRLLSWYENGTWAVDKEVFDVGIQTAYALRGYQNGLTPEECGMLNPDGKGNGALMRTLPLALWHSVHGSPKKEQRDRALAEDAHRQCLITHGHVCNQVCCALYCLTAQGLLDGLDAQEAIETGTGILRKIYQDMPEYEQELEWSIRPDQPWEGTGTGYVVDCLRSAFMILIQASGYEDGVKRAVLLGNDTDTTACVAGGLLGIRYGVQGIPDRWLSMLREREQAAALLRRCLENG